jgi:hypothetical protein
VDGIANHEQATRPGSTRLHTEKLLGVGWKGVSMKSLGESLPEEQARVRKLIQLYRDPWLAGAGAFAAAMMEIALKEADQAVMSGDPALMIAAYKNLKEFHE